jgi:redox-sensitive bicupin YhaK (pirin superfamily)
MDRKDFLKKGLMGTGMLITAGAAAKMIQNSVDELQPLEPMLQQQVGFNHLPNQKTEKMENFVYHPANSRGGADHGWLKTRHSFSFAQYYNPERMHFGVLRVLNDDHITGGAGFGTHPHDNMEIISIPLEGALQHKDSMGNKAVIVEGDVQVMSAGTGIQHSEFNNHPSADCRFLQIWLFPNKKNVEPRYDQLTLKLEDRKNKLQQILSPSPEDEGVWIHQNAWFHMTQLDANHPLKYELKDKANGVYFFVLSGEVTVNGKALNTRDGLGAWAQSSFDIQATSDAELLLMEVPMTI